MEKLFWVGHIWQAFQASCVSTDTLFAFDTTEPLNAEQLGRRTDQSRNQVFRCIKTLQEYGLIAERDEGYVLTPMMLKLMPSLRRDPLAMVAEPYLRELQAETDETVNLVARWDQNETITLATFPSRHSIRLVSQVGQVSFLHAGAVPKAVLAFASREEQEQVLAELAAYPRYTEWTVLDHGKLREEIRKIRERGYSISDQDFEAGGRGVGAPIFDGRGNPIGGISVGGPTVRVSLEVLSSWGPHLQHVADRISAELGWTGSPSPANTSPGNRKDDAS